MTKLMEIELVMTDIASDIDKVYAIVDNHRFDIGSKLKDIARIIDDGIDDYECGIICINAYDDKYDDVGMTNANGADTDIGHGDLLP